MAKARKIKKRARAVESIRTVTRTMDMVASASFKRAHDRAAGARPYTDRMTDLVAALQHRAPEKMHHPLLTDPTDLKRDIMLVLTSNRGMCASLNPTVIRTALARVRQVRNANYEMLLHVVGKRGIRHFQFRRVPVDREFPDFVDVPPYDVVADLADEYMALFLDEKISGLEVAYMQFISSGKQSPAIAQILPMTNLEAPPRPSGAVHTLPPYDFVPEPKEILEQLLPVTVRLRLYQCFLDSSLSEQIMRIQAMRNATDSADEMLGKLTTEYNRLRQSQITTELSEIMGGTAGLADDDVPRQVAQQLNEGLDREMGRLPVHVRTARPLTDDQREQIVRTVRESFHFDPTLDVEVEPELVGGLVLQVGDRIFDTSVAGKLASIRRRVDRRIRNQPD